MNRITKAGRFVAATAVGLLLILLLHTRGHVIEPRFLHYLVIWIPLIALLEWLRARQAVSYASPVVSGRTWPVAGLLVCMVLFFYSSITDHPWFYFIDWMPDSVSGWHFLGCDMGRFVLLTALLTPLLVVLRRRLPVALAALLLAAMIACGLQLLIATGGAALYRDDHPSFMFRLWEFGQTNLQLVNYNPYWNGGLVETHFTQSGAAAIGALFWPLLLFFPIDQIYTWILLATFIILVPLLAAGSLKIMGANRTAACCAGFMALGVSQPFFLWLLSYGTIGACLASACILPVSACLFRVMLLDRREWWLGAILVASSCIWLMWPPAAMMIPAVALAFMVNWRRWSWPKWRFLLCCAGLILLLHMRRALVIMMAIGIFNPQGLTMAPPGQHGVSMDMLLDGWQQLVEYLRMGHPLILFLGIGGVLVSAHPLIRRWFGPIVLGLLLLTGWGWIILPDLQLHRMSIPIFFAAIAPAAVMAADILRSRAVRLALLRAVVVAILIMGAWNTALMFGNEGRATYNLLSPEVRAMAAWLKADGADGGRVLFAGSTIHGYEDGHVAFLACLAGREMMACDYYHFSAGAVEYDYPPRPWRETPETVLRFLDLYNVTTVTTCRDTHRDFLKAHPEHYRPVKEFGENGALAFFKVLRPASYFLENSGTLKTAFNHIEVALQQPDRPAVIKYNWHPGLTVTPPAILYPLEAGPGVTLIGIRPNGLSNLEIHYSSWL